MTLEDEDTEIYEVPGHARNESVTRTWDADDIGPSAFSRYRAWVRQVPESGLTLTSAPVVWSAAEILHLTHVSWMGPGLVTLVAGSVIYGRAARKAARSKHPHLEGGEAAALIAAPLAWTALATKLGPLWGPFDLMTWAWAAMYGGGYAWLRSHKAVKSARQRRADAIAEAERLAAEQAAWKAKHAEWNSVATKVDLRGSFLVEVIQNKNESETWIIDLYSSGTLADDVPCGRVAKRLSGEKLTVLGGWTVPKNRVEVMPDKDMAYRLIVTFYRQERFSAAASGGGIIWHPMASGTLDPDAPGAQYFTNPAPSIYNPICLGLNPETEAPLLLTLIDEEGARRILVLGRSGSGKSMILDTIRERVTACPDAELICVNLSKGMEDKWWDPILAASALTDDIDDENVRAKALMILDFIHDVVNGGRPRQRGQRSHKPRPGEPALVLMIDEVDKTASDEERRRQLGVIASKCRSEGIILIIGSQRPQDVYIGGGMVRSNLSDVVWGILRSNDLSAASGGLAGLPDMNEYGRGQAGVFGVAPYPVFEGASVNRGRAFFWGADSPGLISIIDAREAANGGQRPYQELEPAMRPKYGPMWAEITGNATEADKAANQARLASRGDTARYDPSAAQGEASAQDKLDDAARLLLGEPPARRAPAVPAAAAQATRPPQDAAPAATSAPSRAAPPASGALPAPEREALWDLLGRPEGISARGAAEQIPRSVPSADGRTHWSYETILTVLREWESQGAIVRRGVKSTTTWHRADTVVPPRLHSVPPRAETKTNVSGVAAATGDEADEDPDEADEDLPGPQESEVVLMAAAWGLTFPDLATARAHALRMDVPEDQADEAMELLQTRRGYVAEYARDVFRRAAPGKPLPEHIAANLPEGAAS